MVEKKTRSEDVLLLISYARNENYEFVVKQYDSLSDTDKLDSKAMYFLAEAFYEQEEDVLSLKAYADFVCQHPHSRAVDFALMGMAVCLKNLNLQPQALNILTRVKPNHIGLDKETKHSKETIYLQSKAKAILEDFDKKFR